MHICLPVNQRGAKIKTLLPRDNEAFEKMVLAAKKRRMIFFSGLPAAGKSLFLQQQAVMAAQAERRIHFLRWDVAVDAFQTEALLASYPESENVTHPLIRKAAGLWSRQAISRWNTEFPDPDDLLIGEFPISNNRFVELVQVRDDDAEALLAGDSAVFFVPVPTNEVRHQLVAKRQASIRNPQHLDEELDAPMHTLANVWRETCSLAVDLGLVNEGEITMASDYDSSIYRCFFQYLLQHRNCHILTVDEVYADAGSAHDIDVEKHELLATADEVADCIDSLETAWDIEDIYRSVENWYKL